MTKDSQDSDFLKSLERSLNTPLKDSKDIVSLDGNSIDANEDGKLEKADYEKIATSGEMSGGAVLRDAFKVWRREFFPFLKVNLILTVGFLLIIFALLLKWGSAIHNLTPKIFKFLPILQAVGLKSILPIVFLAIFSIYFAWLRASYLAVASNFFSFDEHFKPLRVGLKKIISFTLVECLQLVTFIIGFLLFVIPSVFLTAKYFLALPAMIYQDDEAIGSMIASREYSKGHRLTIVRLMLFISFFTFTIMAAFFVVSHLLIKNPLILWPLNFFLFSFLILPLHSCFRFVLYEKLQHLIGEQKFIVGFEEKIGFVTLRIAFLVILVIVIFFVVKGGFGALLDQLIFFISNTFPEIKKWKMN